MKICCKCKKELTEKETAYFGGKPYCTKTCYWVKWRESRYKELKWKKN